MDTKLEVIRQSISLLVNNVYYVCFSVLDVRWFSWYTGRWHVNTYRKEKHNTARSPRFQYPRWANKRDNCKYFITIQRKPWFVHTEKLFYFYLQSFETLERLAINSIMSCIRKKNRVYSKNVSFALVPPVCSLSCTPVYMHSLYIFI